MAPPQWAYQVEHFITEPDEELVCSICRSVFCDPALCPCNHVFCHGCISKWLQSNRNCPICRKRVSNSSVKMTVPIVKNLIMKLMLNCHNKSLGCKSQFSLESSESHMKECEYEFVQCRNKPCKDKLFRKDILEHETGGCPHRYIKCKKCGSKMTTSAKPDKHDCIRALQLRLRRKNNIIRKKNNRIKELKNEVLKAVSKEQEPQLDSLSRFRRSLTSSALSSISPDEITINIQEYDSQFSSVTSDSDTSAHSIVIFSNEPLEQSDDNLESDSFSTYMDNENVEYSPTESTRDAAEYCNATVQTDQNETDGMRYLTRGRRSNVTNESDSVTVEVPNSVFGDVEGSGQPSRQVKRRPFTDKPAKRRLLLQPHLSSSGDDDEEDEPKASTSGFSNQRLRQAPAAAETNEGDYHSMNMEAGPSSAYIRDPDFRSSITNSFLAKSKFDKKQAKQNVCFTAHNARDQRVLGVNTFDRTIALLEQYNLESDPEWLPEYASHRGNDTTTDTNSSFSMDESSTSEFSDPNFRENMRGGSEDGPPAISEFMHWMFDSTSEDDPDWQPGEGDYISE